MVTIPPSHDGIFRGIVESHLIPRNRLLLHRFGADEGLQDGRDQPGNVGQRTMLWSTCFSTLLFGVQKSYGNNYVYIYIYIN